MAQRKETKIDDQSPRPETEKRRQGRGSPKRQYQSQHPDATAESSQR